MSTSSNFVGEQGDVGESIASAAASGDAGNSLLSSGSPDAGASQTHLLRKVLFFAPGYAVPIQVKDNLSSLSVQALHIYLLYQERSDSLFLLLLLSSLCL